MKIRGDYVDTGDLNIFIQLLILVLLTAINAFFACAEMAIVSVNKNKINALCEEGNKKAKLIVDLLEEPTRFLSTIQVAITLAGFFASAFAATSLSNRLSGLLQTISIPYSNEIAVVGITIILSYFTLVFGELVPKRIALQKANTISLFVVKPILMISKIVSPFVKFLSFSTNLVLKIMGMHHEQLEEQVSEEEIKSMVKVGKEHGVFNDYEQDLIESIFEFDDTIAREIMTARKDVYCIDKDEPISKYLDELLAQRHSRIPVYQDTIDNIIGVIYMKDFIIEAYKKGFENVQIENILHEAYFVPETKNIDELFKELQKNKYYIAILIDEYGGFSGVVTIEDLVEEVMGPIDEEGEEESPFIEKIDANTYRLHGLVMLDDVNDELDLHIDSEENHATVSGVLIDALGAIPTNCGQEIHLGEITFVIEKIVDRRIEQCLLIKESQKTKE